VENRNTSTTEKSLLNIIRPFARAAATALEKKTADGLYRSAIVSIANTKVPVIKPNCIKDVIEANAEGGRCKSFEKSDSTALPPNHKLVQRNCERTITGKTIFLSKNIIVFDEDKKVTVHLTHPEISTSQK